MEIQNFKYIVPYHVLIGVRDGGAGGGSCPPKKIRKSKSRANVEISRAKCGK
jgi:hypothetical protein